MSRTSIPIVSAYCNSCMQETKHRLIFTVERIDSEEEEWLFQQILCHTYVVLECCGCEGITFGRRTLEGERNVVEDFGLGKWKIEEDSGGGPLNAEYVYYPPRVCRRWPRWLSKLPEEQRSLLHEVYAALNADSRALAAMGTRAVLDMVIMDRIGDRGNFQQKLQAMVDEGWISLLKKDILYAALDAGNAASHRGHTPSGPELITVMDIVEHLLMEIYHLPTAAQELEKNTPRRAKPNVGP